MHGGADMAKMRKEDDMKKFSDYEFVEESMDKDDLMDRRYYDFDGFY